MIFVPILNDVAHTHLTKADWESLAFTHVAIDVINLFIHPQYIIPENAQTLFLDIRIRSCHKISGKKNSEGNFCVHSPHNGQKILITPESIQTMMERFSNISNAVVVIINEINQPTGYEISEKPGRDAEKGTLYSASRGEINIQEKKWADILEPIEPTCHCYTCKNFTLAYLHHLHNVKVPLGVRLGIVHNLYGKSPLHSEKP
jgi:queuine/archaeosine tRNA-ribosyltransferase